METHLYAYIEMESACFVCGSLGSPVPTDVSTFPVCNQCTQRGYNIAENKRPKLKDVMALPLPLVRTAAAAADTAAAATAPADDDSLNNSDSDSNSNSKSETGLGKRGATTTLSRPKTKVSRIASKPEKNKAVLTLQVPVEAVEQELSTTAANLRDQLQPI
jgi:hypothetical protein